MHNGDPLQCSSVTKLARAQEAGKCEGVQLLQHRLCRLRVDCRQYALKHQGSNGLRHRDGGDVGRNGEFSALAEPTSSIVFLVKDVIQIELLDWLHGTAALLQDPPSLINLESVLLPLLRSHGLVFNITGLLLVAPLLWLALILPLIDDNSLNVFRVDERLQEPLAIADGDKPFERLRLPQLLDPIK